MKSAIAKILTLALAVSMVAGAAVGCGENSSDTNRNSTSAATGSQGSVSGQTMPENTGMASVPSQTSVPLEASAPLTSESSGNLSPHTLSQADVVGKWKMSVDDHSVEAVIQLFKSSNVDMLSGMEKLMTRDEIVSFLTQETDLVLFEFEQDGTFKNLMDLSRIPEVAKRMSAEMLKILKRTDLDTACSMFGGDPDQMKSMLEAQGLTWEQYLENISLTDTFVDASGQKLLEIIKSQYPIDNNFAVLSTCQYRIENDRLVVDDKTGTAVYSYDGTALVVESLKSTGESSQAIDGSTLKLVEGIRLVRAS